jgi:transaldolase
MTAEATPIGRTIALGADFWNDSCDPRELGDAVAQGATGATSNPVIVCTALKGDPGAWVPVLDALISDFPTASEDDLAWKLIESIGVKAAALLRPAWERTQGRKGYLSMQVNPKLYRDAARMAEHGRALAALAPNIAIKVPSTEAGLQAAEDLVADGINVNATVSFTVPQALAVARTFERGRERARARGLDSPRLHPYATVMVGRLDDHLQRVLVKDGVSIDPGYVHWAGIAVMKKVVRLFREKGYAAIPLTAAYRHHMHWSALVGPGIVHTIPYAWWTQYNRSGVDVAATLDVPVEARIVDTLLQRFPDFRRAYDEDGMAPPDFVHYGATLHTLNQFIGGYHDLLGFVRERMLR